MGIVSGEGRGKTYRGEFTIYELQLRIGREFVWEARPLRAEANVCSGGLAVPKLKLRLDLLGAAVWFVRPLSSSGLYRPAVTDRRYKKDEEPLGFTTREWRGTRTDGYNSRGNRISRNRKSERLPARGG
jgi:hypothetical protein